jgi:hypothetical protein
MRRQTVAVHRNPLARLMPVSKEVRDRLTLRAYSALEAIARGEHPGEEEWRDLADVCNVVETLTLDMRRLPALTLAYTETASESLRDAAHRFSDTRKIRVDGPGLASLRGLLEIYSQALEALTERVMEEAFARTKQVIEKKLRDGAEAVTV